MEPISTDFWILAAIRKPNRVVMKSNSKLLTFGQKTCDEVAKNLTSYLESLTGVQLRPEMLEEEQPPAKRARRELEFQGNFNQQDKTVAVYDDHQCYIGNVLQVKKDGKEATITFMKQVRNRNVFVWTQVE